MARIETYARPTWLYRYRSLHGLGDSDRENRRKLGQEIDALLKRYIYCARYNQMNDPMEGFFRSSTGLRSVDGYEDFIATLHDEKLRLGIASFSETWSNGLMWAHYADGFRGICIAYSVQRLLEGLSGDCALARMAYDDRPHYLNTRGVESADARARAILSTKSLPWTYEREWRLFAPRAGEAHYRLPAATKVYLGPRMSDDDATCLSARLADHQIALIRTHVEGYAVKTGETSNCELEEC